MAQTPVLQSRTWLVTGRGHGGRRADHAQYLHARARGGEPHIHRCGRFAGTGNALNNVINGNGGADTLNGGADHDRFVATINDGNDTYNGGAGTDTYDLSGTTADATITTTSSTSTQTGTGILSSIAKLVGSQGDDVITFNGGVNVIDGDQRVSPKDP